MTNAKILIIDDEQNIIDLVTAYLRQESYEVFAAMDGPSGLKAARAFNPDLIVLDVMLPECSLPNQRRPTRLWACRWVPMTT
jgi:two-component system alkaline phosphatase synthesis response regulator PhoP